MKKNLLFTVALACLTTGAWAQINVPATGVGPITFDTLPPATEWATGSLAGGGNTWLDIAAVTAALPAASAVVNAVNENAAYGTHGSGFYRNTTANTLFSDPTGIAGMWLCAKLVNGAGFAVPSLQIDYDILGTADAMELPGHCVFYSFSGDVGTWIEIPSLTGVTGGGGTQHVTATLDFSPGGWAGGGTLFLLFVDDNGDGATDNYVAVDNFIFLPGGGPLSVLISPENPTVLQCGSITFEAHANGGTPPYTYTWSKDGIDLEVQPNGPELVLNNVQPGIDDGYYSVTILDSTPGNPGYIVSPESLLTINPNDTTPAFVDAVGTPDLYHVTLSFSKPISIANVGGIQVQGNVDATLFTISDATVVNETNIALTTIEQRNQKCKILIQEGAVVDSCNGLSVPAVSQDFLDIIGFNWDQSWYYDGTGLTDWDALGWEQFSFPDEVTWAYAPAPFDDKNGAMRATLGGLTINTHLPRQNPNSTWGTTDIPTFYFRTHFYFPDNVDPDQTLVELYRFFDDHAVVWLNGQEIFRSPEVTDITQPWAQYTGANAVGDASIQGPQILSASDFQVGDNVIAVLLKQEAAGSSDIDMAMALSITITNFYITGYPIEFTMNPSSAALQQCDNLSIHAVITRGTRPFKSYTWTRNGVPLSNGGNISGADTSTLTVANVFPGEDDGDYQLTIVDGADVSASSPFVSVTIAADTAPAMLSAVGRPDLQTILVSFDRAISVTDPAGSDFIVVSPDSTGDLTVNSAVVTDGTNVTLTTVEPRENKNYDVVINSEGVQSTTCTMMPVPVNTKVSLVSQFYIFSIDVNNEWQYNDAGVGLPVEWINYNYDDSTGQNGWKTGLSLLDAYRTDRVGQQVGGQTIRTWMNMTNETTQYTVDSIPSFYFRKHFSTPAGVPLENITLSCDAFFDDHGMIYINGEVVYQEPEIVATNIDFPFYVGPAANGLTTDIPLSMTSVIAGDNVMAVYVKNVNATSSDADMGINLIANIIQWPAAGPRLSITRINATQAIISWDPAQGTLQESTDLKTWSSSAVVNGGTINISTGKRFFRVAP